MKFRKKRLIFFNYSLNDFCRPPVNKRKRIFYSEYEKSYLNRFYEERKYPTKFELELISRRLEIPVKNIRIFFQNRRSKDIFNFNFKL